MNRWQSDWRSIDARISGLEATVSMMTRAAALPGLNYEQILLSATKQTILNIGRSVSKFSEDYADVIPPSATTVLAALLYGPPPLPQTGAELSTWQAAINAIAALIGKRAEVSMALLDYDSLGRQRTARAFEHLARSIIVDDGLKARWETAFQTDEVACERLGAVHLLLHGIWAFKVDAIGERTDLVLQEKLDITRTVAEATDFMVLTEWKLVRNIGELSSKADEGRHQAARYSRSSLAATELAAIRYIVLVTQYGVVVPADIADGSRIYRFVNIAVSPESPSVAARRAVGRPS